MRSTWTSNRCIHGISRLKISRHKALAGEQVNQWPIFVWLWKNISMNSYDFCHQNGNKCDNKYSTAFVVKCEHFMGQRKTRFSHLILSFSTWNFISNSLCLFFCIIFLIFSKKANSTNCVYFNGSFEFSFFQMPSMIILWIYIFFNLCFV